MICPAKRTSRLDGAQWGTGLRQPEGCSKEDVGDLEGRVILEEIVLITEDDLVLVERPFACGLRGGNYAVFPFEEESEVAAEW